MNKNLKIGLILLVVASVFFLCSTVAFFILKEEERQKRISLEEELKKTLEAKESLAGELEGIKAFNRDLESKLTSAKKEAQKISEELAKEKEGKKILESQVEEGKKKADELMIDVMKEKETRLDLVQQLSKAEEAYSRLKEQFELMVDAKETLEARLKDMMSKKGVELEKIEVRSEYQEDAATEDVEYSSKDADISEVAKSANVLIVNRKFDFIVVNIGRSDGVDLGEELDVYRDGEFVAKTRIEKIYDNMSAATILPEWENTAIKEGDQVCISK